MDNSNFKNRNKKVDPLLRLACCLGRLDKVSEYLTAAADPNTKNDLGWTPLHEAVRDNRLDIVQKLIQHNVLINVPGINNETPLHVAVKYEYTDIVKELIINGADLNARNYKGVTPLDLASEQIKKIIKKVLETQNLPKTVNVIQPKLDFDQIYVYCDVYYFFSVKSRLKKLVNLNRNFHIEKQFTTRVTHLIVDTRRYVCKCSSNVLKAIAGRVCIISSNWVRECKLENMRDYEVKGVSKLVYNGPRNAVYSKYNLLPGLFHGCHFYLYDLNKPFKMYNMNIDKIFLSKIITKMDGVLLKYPPHPQYIPEEQKTVPYHTKKGSKLGKCSHYIIYRVKYEPHYNITCIKALPCRWLIKCVMKYKLFDPY